MKLIRKIVYCDYFRFPYHFSIWHKMAKYVKDVCIVLQRYLFKLACLSSSLSPSLCATSSNSHSLCHPLCPQCNIRGWWSSSVLKVYSNLLSIMLEVLP